MNNVFLTQHFDWNSPGPRWVRYSNRILKTLGIHSRLVPPQSTGATTSVEQRINMYHLLMQLLVFGVPGEVIEVGTDIGSSAALLQKVLTSHGSTKSLHVYDLFPTNQQPTMLKHFESLQLPAPTIHGGWIQETLPAQLPETIAFAHVDLGPGASPEKLQQGIGHALESIYPRLMPAGVCLVADYCDPDVYRANGFTFPRNVPSARYLNLFPTVKMACDEFLADKPETMHVLYGGEYSHAFFRRAI